MTNPSFQLLQTVQSILNSEIDPLLELYSSNNDDSPELIAIYNKLNDLYSLIASQRPAYYGLFTCLPSQAITANDQLIHFSTKFGGTLDGNADGTITLPSNTRWLLDCDINGTFSVSGSLQLVVYNADSGSNILTIFVQSENFNSTTDLAEIRVQDFVVGSSPIRIGVKVVTKQSSGTFTMLQYASYIKLQEF